MNPFSKKLDLYPTAPHAVTGTENRKGFTLVELLVVIGIIAIILAIASPLVPGLLKSSSMGSNVTTLAGILDEAREAATAGNTYIWVTFTAPITTSKSPAKGIWVGTIQSQDGTETGINTGTTATPVWATALTVPNPNLLLHSKVQSLPGVALVQLSKLPSSLTAPANTAVPTGATDLVQSESALGLAWNLTTMANTGAGSGVTFNYAIEFTPNGEAHVPTWNANIQFGLSPAVGTTTNSVLFNVSRLTGKVTVFRM